MGKRGRLCGQMCQSMGLPIDTARTVMYPCTDNQYPIDLQRLSRRYRFAGLDREFVNAFIFRVPVMPSDPVEADDMALAELVEFFPEVDILHGLFPGGFPAAALPAIHPFLESFEDILGIGIQLNEAGQLEIREPLDYGLELHTIVGGIELGSGLFALLAGFGVYEEIRPAAGTWVPGAGAIGKEVDLALGSVSGWIFGRSLGHRADHTHPNESCRELLVYDRS
jgi:hypothetical protein